MSAPYQLRYLRWYEAPQRLLSPSHPQTQADIDAQCCMFDVWPPLKHLCFAEPVVGDWVRGIVAGHWAAYRMHSNKQLAFDAGGYDQLQRILDAASADIWNGALSI
jgi:hypothetical protein